MPGTSTSKQDLCIRQRDALGWLLAGSVPKKNLVAFVAHYVEGPIGDGTSPIKLRKHKKQTQNNATMATTAVAPSAAAASGDADSGMSKYYASKIGELSAVRCILGKSLCGCSVGHVFCVSPWPSERFQFLAVGRNGGDTRRCAVYLDRSAPSEPWRRIYICLFSAWEKGALSWYLSTSR